MSPPCPHCEHRLRLVLYAFGTPTPYTYMDCGGTFLLCASNIVSFDSEPRGTSQRYLGHQKEPFDPVRSPDERYIQSWEKMRIHQHQLQLKPDAHGLHFTCPVPRTRFVCRFSGSPEGFFEDETPCYEAMQCTMHNAQCQDS